MIAGFDPNADHIRLDDYPYRLGDAVVRFQDARGLINLNLGSSSDLFNVLGTFEISANDRGPLIAKLQDYIDADLLTRLNGAEAPEYADAGREASSQRAVADTLGGAAHPRLGQDRPDRP